MVPEGRRLFPSLSVEENLLLGTHSERAGPWNLKRVYELFPRLHDLRHAFAVHRLTSWYQQGSDVQNLVFQLSVYLGHAHLADTQAYLSMTPDLLREANALFECYAERGGQP